MSDYDRIEAAFLAAGIDPEFSAVIVEYRTNIYVHALVHTLAKYMERVQELERDTQAFLFGTCRDDNCKLCIQDDPKTWRHK